MDAEIVAADSMQVYRLLDIGTAKPTARERRRVVHHMIDVVEPGVEYNVAAYVRDAHHALQSILARSKTALVVGGTGLYVKALIDGIFEGPPKEDRIRKRLHDEMLQGGASSLHERLRLVDPLSASRIPSTNARRLIRALEVYELTGRPISELQSQWASSRGKAVTIVGLDRGRDDLYRRINERVDGMFEAGLVEEVTALRRLGIEHNPVVMQAIGYKEVMDYLMGLCSLDEAEDRVRKNTRRLAKRQLTWFRRDPRIQWLVFGENETPAEMAGRVLKLLERPVSA